MIKNNIIFNDASDWKFDIQKAEGSYIWTNTGQKLIDFTSAWNVTNLGWNNSEVSQAISDQLSVNGVNLLWGSDDIQIEYATKLLNALPQSLDTISRATGGTEANEEALKTARAYTGRTKVIGFKDTYHGQSFGAMAIGYRPEYVTAIAPLVPGFVQIDYPLQDLEVFAEELERQLTQEDVAAVVTEAGIITGWGSTCVAPSGYLRLVRDLTKKYGTLLILDEVGTGFSRCGKLWGMQLENVVPDIATFAKGLSNGRGAIGAMVTTREIANTTLGKTNLTSTFGWNPLSCAAANKTLEIHLRDKVWETASMTGSWMMESLKGELEQNREVADIRGIGMEIGLEFTTSEKANDVVTKAFTNGLHLIVGDGGNIQIMPIINEDRAVLQKGLDVLFESIKA